MLVFYEVWFLVEVCVFAKNFDFFEADYLDLIEKEGLLVNLLDLANGVYEPPVEEDKEEPNPNGVRDRRVQYETARLLCRFAEKEKFRPILWQHKIQAPLLELLSTKFDILHKEALTAFTFLLTNKSDFVSVNLDPLKSSLSTFVTSDVGTESMRKKVVSLLE